MGWVQDDMGTWQQKDGSKIWLYCSQVQVENILENRDAVTLVINIYNREKLRPLHVDMWLQIHVCKMQMFNKSYLSQF